MSEILTPEVLLRYPIVFILGWLLWLAHKERKEDREARAQGAKACHEEMRVASEGLRMSAEAMAGIRAALEALVSQIAEMRRAVDSHTSASHRKRDERS